MSKTLLQLKRELAWSGALHRGVDHVADLIDKHLGRKAATEAARTKEAAWAKRQLWLHNLKKKGSAGASVSSLRKEFESRKAVKDYRVVEGSISAVRKVWEDYINPNVTDAEKKNSRQFLDQSLIILFNKTLDPGSVVRESEFARTPEMQGLLNRMKGFFPKLKEGGTTLIDSEREALVNTLLQIADGRYTNFKKDADFFTTEAEKSGIQDPSRVVSDYNLPSPNFAKYTTFNTTGNLPPVDDKPEDDGSEGVVSQIKNLAGKGKDLLESTLSDDTPEAPVEQRPELPPANPNFKEPAFFLEPEKDKIKLFQ